MTKKIFKNTLFVSLVTFAISLLMIIGVLYEYLTVQLENELEAETLYAGTAVEEYGTEYLSRLDLPAGRRITWIAADGTALFDSQADIVEMENHSDRKEVKSALENGIGSDIRRSETLSEKTVYFARRLSDGSVIRVSGVQLTAWLITVSMVRPILIVLVIALILAAVLSSATSKMITKPINSLDLSNPELDGGYEEIAPLIVKINKQNRMIQRQLGELSRQRQEFETITDNMNEGLLVIDNKTAVLSYNRAAIRLLNAETEPKDAASALTLNRSEAFRTAIDEALSGKHSIQSMTDGELCRQIIANPVNCDGEVTGAVMLIMDVTDRQRLENMRREFTSNVSHELKTPLTSIYGMSEIMMTGNMEKEDAKDFAKSIHDESGRLIGLVNDILKLSQLDENRATASWENVDLHELANTTARRLKTQCREKNVTFTVGGESAVVHGVYEILEELVYNLCDNAVKYNKQGGSITVTTGHINGRPSITVEDTGIGIPREHLGRIFERFYRVDKSHSKKIGGTGLGLSIVKHAAAFHNGEVTVESRVGEGTKMTAMF